MVERQKISPHPNDGCDDNKCYEVMMAERSTLITARRESEDNLIKTIITLSSALIPLMSGFAFQKQTSFGGWGVSLFAIALIFFGLAIVAGMSEQLFSSKAYQEQQTMLEDFYNKFVDTFEEAPSNVWVRRFQVSAFTLFVLALSSLGLFGFIEAKGNNDGQPAASSAAAPSTAASASATASAAPSTTASATGEVWRRHQSERNQVGGADNAAIATKEVTR